MAEAKNQAPANEAVETKAEETQKDVSTEETNSPTIEELMAQLAAEKAQRAKDKNALDKALKEKGEVTKQLRAKQSQQEIEDEAKAEAEKRLKEEYEATVAELNHLKAAAAYKTLDDDTVETLISAIADNDHESIAVIIEAEKAKAVKEAKADWLKSRPALNAGEGGSKLSVEEIMAVDDPAERQRLIAENLSAFSS